MDARSRGGAGSARSRATNTFFIPGASPHYAPDLPLRLEHILLDVEVDPRSKVLRGTITHRVRVIAPGQRWMKLDQVGLKIEEVQVKGRKARFEVEGHELRIELAADPGQVPPPGESFEFSVRYVARDPKRGLYFTGPDKEYPEKPCQVWSQGQDEDNRYWFPTFDYPNQKATSEVIATVPNGFTAVSNGALLSRRDVAQGTRFHYRLGTPHVTYLIALTVAEFVEWSDAGPRGLPVQYFVPPGREADGRRAFGNTPRMIEAYEARIGVPYAYEKYSQVAVQDFIFGGMENTSATTQTDLTLHDERAHLDFSSDPLVSHELAHQWFGDLLTCRDWSHGWLNEGFATFMERVWIENNRGPDGGWDEAKYYQYQDLKEYLEEDRSRYRRPIVCNTYIEPIDLFDAHLYQKGGLVLNLIRHVLGEDLFWKSVQQYVTRHRGQNVETLDLIRAIEDTTGRNLRRLFDEWVFSAGHPDFELSYSWHEDRRLVELVVEQKQTNGQPELTQGGVTTRLFHLPVTIELTFEGGATSSHRVEIGELRDRIFLEARTKPLMIRFDPGNFIPKTLKFPRSKEMLIYQLQHDTDVMGRIEAIQELRKLASEPDAVEALAKAAREDGFWGVQAEAAPALAELRTDRALGALIDALGTANPKARRAIARALGGFKDDRATQALRKLAESDSSYYVEADATYSWAMTQVRGEAHSEPALIEPIEKFLALKLEQPSYREVIRSAALRALAELPGVGRGERPGVLPLLMSWSRKGRPLDARLAAIDAMGRVAKWAVPAERKRVLDAFSYLADEPSFRIRMGLVHALEGTDSPDALPILGKIRTLEVDGRIRRSATLAMDHLQTAGTTPESVGALKTSLERLEEEHRKLKTMLEEMRAGLPGGGGSPSPKQAAPG